MVQKYLITFSTGRAHGTGPFKCSNGRGCTGSTPRLRGCQLTGRTLERRWGLHRECRGTKAIQNLNFLAVWLAGGGHVTPGPRRWLVEPPGAGSPCLKLRVPARGRAGTAPAMFSSKSRLISLVFANKEPWNVTESQNIYANNTSLPLQPPWNPEKFRQDRQKGLRRLGPGFPPVAEPRLQDGDGSSMLWTRSRQQSLDTRHTPTLLTGKLTDI